MRILVTGATGFVGQHVAAKFVALGHEVVAVARDREKARKHSWYDQVEFVEADLYSPASDVGALVRGCEVLVHLAWSGLPNYKARFHFEHNLHRDYDFLSRAVRAGLKHMIVAGTCLEYGLANGCIAEDAPTAPTVAYALAKDTLHRFLRLLQLDLPFTLQWARLFYVYGPGQNPKSLLSQLDRAIDAGLESFDMSRGEQLRDYISVGEVANIFARLLNRPDIDGPINCCSGDPVSVRRVVEKHLAQRGAKIELKLGTYPYPDYEPLAFWGHSSKLGRLHEGHADAHGRPEQGVQGDSTRE